MAASLSWATWAAVFVIALLLPLTLMACPRLYPPWATHNLTRLDLAAGSASGADGRAGPPSQRYITSTARTSPTGKERPLPGLVQALLPAMQRAENPSSALASALQTLQRYDWADVRLGPGDGPRMREGVRRLLTVPVGAAAAEPTPGDTLRTLESLAALQRQRGFFSLHLSTEVSQLATSLMDRLGQRGFRQLDGHWASALIWASSKLQLLQGRDILVRLCRRMTAPDVRPSLSPADVVVAIRGLAKAQVTDEPFLREMSAFLLSGDRLLLLDAPELADLAWGCARLGYQDAPLMAAVAERVTTVFCDAEQRLAITASTATTTAWAFATLNVRHEALMAALARHVLEGGVLPTMTAQGIADVAWAFARLNVRNEPLMEALARRVVEGSALHTMTGSPRWASATLR
eukprot:EG_transcript_3737